MLSGLSNWVEWYLKYMVPLAIVLSVLYALHEQIWPWRDAASVLPARPGQTRISVGGGYEYRADRSERHAEYIFLPSHFADAKVYSVRQLGDRVPTVCVTRSPIVTASSLLALFGFVGSSIWCWRRRSNKSPPNKSLERTRGR